MFKKQLLGWNQDQDPFLWDESFKNSDVSDIAHYIGDTK